MKKVKMGGHEALQKVDFANKGPAEPVQIEADGWVVTLRWKPRKHR